eukprot:2502917-Pyramimonas_sp.AAC.1
MFWCESFGFLVCGLLGLFLLVYVPRARRPGVRPSSSPGASRVKVRGRVSRSGPSSWCESLGLHVV